MTASLNSILSVARTALQAEQLALQVAGHNLANANTEGYSRQRANLVARTPLQTPEGLLGTGVRVADVTRARNLVLEPAVRRETSFLSAARLAHGALGQLEAVLSNPVGPDLGSSLDSFWNAWSDLANDPLSRTARVAVRAAGEAAVNEMGRAASSLDGALGEVSAGLSVELGEVNGLIAEIAELNGRVAAAQSVTGSAPDLMDRRDALLDRLASLVPVEVTFRAQGTVGVSVDGLSVVEGTTATSLSLDISGGTYTLTTATGLSLEPSSGSIGAALRLVNDDFQQLRAQLDEIARALVVGVNDLHATGTAPSGATGALFFDDLGDPASVTARTLALAPGILADVDGIAAGTPEGGGGYRPGANDVALALAGLRTNGVAGLLGGRAISVAQRDLLGELGVSVAGRRSAEERHGLLLSAAQERRESVAGVVTDEELVHIVQIQAAYQAAARLITVVDEMYQTLLSV